MGLGKQMSATHDAGGNTLGSHAGGHCRWGRLPRPSCHGVREVQMKKVGVLLWCLSGGEREKGRTQRGVGMPSRAMTERCRVAAPHTIRCYRAREVGESMQQVLIMREQTVHA